MDGLYIKHKCHQEPFKIGNSEFVLNFKNQDIEILTQKFEPDDLVWISPSEDADFIEFYYVISGEIKINLNSGNIILTQGDSFYVEDIKEDIKIHVEVATVLLNVVNKPIFEEIVGFEGDLDALLTQIEEKDRGTYQHGRNVMNYAIKIMEKLSDDSVSIHNISVAALFHDIGKYYTPTEILNKTSSLTQKELMYIMRHPRDSRKLLQKQFGKTIAEIAEGHHERLDGSGYPYGLTADGICLESRIIAISDTFDAMTTQRSYNKPKTHLEAVDELLSLTHLYDERVILAFKELILSGAFGGKYE